MFSSAQLPDDLRLRPSSSLPSCTCDSLSELPATARSPTCVLDPIPCHLLKAILLAVVPALFLYLGFFLSIRSFYAHETGWSSSYLRKRCLLAATAPSLGVLLQRNSSAVLVFRRCSPRLQLSQTQSGCCPPHSTRKALVKDTKSSGRSWPSPRWPDERVRELGTSSSWGLSTGSLSSPFQFPLMSPRVPSLLALACPRTQQVLCSLLLSPAPERPASNP